MSYEELCANHIADAEMWEKEHDKKDEELMALQIKHDECATTIKDLKGKLKTAQAHVKDRLSAEQIIEDNKEYMLGIVQKYETKQMLTMIITAIITGALQF